MYHLLTSLCVVAVPEVCSPTRECDRRERQFANSSAGTEEQEDAVSLRILLPCTIILHVAAHTDIVSKGWDRKSIALALTNHELGKVAGLERHGCTAL